MSPMMSKNQWICLVGADRTLRFSTLSFRLVIHRRATQLLHECYRPPNSTKKKKVELVVHEEQQSMML
jgi:hypothetical protein